MKDSPFYKKPEYLAVWIHLLLEATHKPHSQLVGNQIVELKPGQLVTGRKSISQSTGVSEMKCFRILKCLENVHQIEQQTFTKYSIISICKWDIYQLSEQQNEQQMNNKRTTNEQQVNTNKNVKNEKNIKPSSSDDEDCIITKRKRKLQGKRLETFLLFWDAFSYKTGKAEAADSWMDIPILTDQVVSDILRAAQLEAEKRPKIKAAGKIPKMAQGWLSGRRWEDETEEVEAWKII